MRINENGDPADDGDAWIEPDEGDLADRAADRYEKDFWGRFE